MEIIIKYLLAIVEKYPVSSGIMATTTNGAAVGLSTFVKSAIPYLQFCSLTLGILIGILTLYGLLRKKKRDGHIVK